MKDEYIGVDLNRDYNDQDWKREGEYYLNRKKWLQNWTEAIRKERERWLLERVRCEYCNFYFWPHEIEYHYSYCRERW